MLGTPENSPRRSPRVARTQHNVVQDVNNWPSSLAKVKKPPPITPRRFNRFFTPRPRNPANVVKTSRRALRAISGSALNSRNGRPIQKKSLNDAEVVTPRGKKRKLSFILPNSLQTSPPSQPFHLGENQEIHSSPTIPERKSPISINFFTDRECDSEDETDIEEEELGGEFSRILPYRGKSRSGALLSTRLGGGKSRLEFQGSRMWQNETASFCSLPVDVNNTFSMNPSPSLPFSATACNTNPLIAVGDEEGRIRLIDTGNKSQSGLSQTWIEMRAHDNAVMDLQFSHDDARLATACGDQTCQIIDVLTQQSLYLLGGHRCSVKKASFMPGSGSNVLASCGRDGQIRFWDLRCNHVASRPQTRRRPSPVPMSQHMQEITATNAIIDAHYVAHPRKDKRSNHTKAERSDFSVTALTFFGDQSSYMLATASEVDSIIKIWDMRTAVSTSKKAAEPVARTQQPKSHWKTRPFGITSLVANTAGTLLYALSKDHTIYAYSTTHMKSDCLRQKRLDKLNSACSNHNNESGIEPDYGFRHPLLSAQTFWPRLAIRKATASSSELLAAGSSLNCALVIPTDERHLTKSAMKLSPLHDPSTNPGLRLDTYETTTSRPPLTRSSSSFSAKIEAASFKEDSSLPIYRHATPLIRGHDKEVTSVCFTVEGNLISASDDYSVRCWREDAVEARSLRQCGETNGARWRKGWAAVGFDDYDDEV